MAWSHLPRCEPADATLFRMFVKRKPATIGFNVKF